MSWRAFCSHSAPGGARFLFHPSEAHSKGMIQWLQNNYHDLMSLNPGWSFRPREVLTNNPHVQMTYGGGHIRAVALYNATEEEVEEAIKALVDYGRNHAPRDATHNLEYEPQVVTYSPATFGLGMTVADNAVGRRDLDNRIHFCSPEERETFDRPGQVRPLRYGSFNRGRGDATFTTTHPDRLAGSWKVSLL